MLFNKWVAIKSIGSTLISLNSENEKGNSNFSKRKAISLDWREDSSVIQEVNIMKMKGLIQEESNDQRDEDIDEFKRWFKKKILRDALK